MEKLNKLRSQVLNAVPNAKEISGSGDFLIFTLKGLNFEFIVTPQENSRAWNFNTKHYKFIHGTELDMDYNQLLVESEIISKIQELDRLYNHTRRG